MNDRHFPKGLTLLLELVAAVAIFAVAAGVCALILAEAETVSRQAASLEVAVDTLTSAAESLRAAEDPAPILEAIEEHPSMGVRVIPDGDLVRYRLYWLEGDTEVWSLDLTCPGEVAP